MKHHEPKRERVIYEHWSKALDTALYYGFTFIDTPVISNKDSSAVEGMKETNGNGTGHLFPNPEEKAAILRTYLEKSMQSLPQPVMLYYEGEVARETHRYRPTKERVIHLEIIGSTRSIAEAMIIQATNAILKDYGFKDIALEINSIGDKDSVGRFIRELTAYYRRHIEDLPASCRQSLKKNEFDMLSCDHEKCKELRDTAPHAMNYLSEPSRMHFKELLEYVESSGVMYSLNNGLLGDRNFCSHTVFQFSGISGSETTPKPVAIGVRYNALSKQVGFKKESGAVGVTLSFTSKSAEKYMKKKIQAPLFYFIQMGEEAKRKSLSIIEMLREEGIRVLHNITRDKLGAQLGAAETVHIPYIIIMGQKEFVDGVAIVRRMSDRSQETIRVTELPAYLKKLSKSLS